MNHELPDVQTGFRKGRGTRGQTVNICWIIEKAREFQKSIYFCFIDYAKALDCVDHKKLWKIVQEMGIPDHWTCLLRNRMQVKKQQLELDMEKQSGSKSGKEYIKAVYCHLAHLRSMQSTSGDMLGWMKHKLESELPGENINNLRYADDTTLMAESEEELKSLLMKVKRRVKSWLKPQHSKN